jgi:hypothetical protein
MMELIRPMQHQANLAASLARLQVFARSMTAELQQLRHLIPVFRPDPLLESLHRQLADQAAAHHQQFSALFAAVEAATASLRPSADMIRRLAEEERVADFIRELGFVPHGELWEHLADLDKPASTHLPGFTERLASEIWPTLRPRLQLSQDACLGDAKLALTFEQLMLAHEAGWHEIALSTVPTVLERAINVVRQPGEKDRTSDWIEHEVGVLPIECVGGMRGYRVWQILIDHTFASCWSDAEADAKKYPNRHASAHGIGLKLASNVDSLNAVLLAHFVITMAKAVGDFRKELAA